MLRNTTLITVFASALAASLGFAQTPQQLGVTHVAGDYTLDDNEDFLNEGARQILTTGTKAIRVWFFDPDGSYWRNSNWGEVSDNLVDIAQHPYYRALFEKPFEVYVLTAYSEVDDDLHYFRRGIGPDKEARETEAFYELTTHLMTTYNGTGKTFIFQHWEGDWAIRGSYDSSPSGDPSQLAIDGMARWLNARQAGVEQARNELTNSDVKVYHASECNLVQIALDGRPTLVNDVWPQTNLDLYAYSAYDTIGIAQDDYSPGQIYSRTKIREALDYMAQKAPDSPTFGHKNVYIGEYGWPIEERGVTRAMRVIQVTTEESILWGCPYILYWQVYDNECSTSWSPQNDECRGFWLLRPDGTDSEAMTYFENLLEPAAPPPSGQITGEVRNQFGQLIETAAVFVRDTDSNVTRETGTYTLTLPAGTYTVDTHKPNHIAASADNVTVTAGQTTTQDFVLTLLPPDPVTNFTVTPDNQQNRIDFTTSSSSHFKGVMIRFSTTDYPQTPTDGTLLIDYAIGPNQSRYVHHYNLTNATPYYYSAFAHNDGASLIYADPVFATGTPASPADMDRDGDVDMDDFGRFQACQTGIAVPQEDPDCLHARLDADEDVDENDHDVFMGCVTGANLPADPYCAD